MLEIAEAPHAPETEHAILDALIAYNNTAGPPARWAPLALTLHEPGNPAILGGLYGACFYDWCVIRLLVIPPAARGQRLGTQLMARAEAFARAQSCIGVWLDTFSFQARPFYEKLGYTPFAELPDHPVGGSRTFLQKRL